MPLGRALFPAARAQGPYACLCNRFIRWSRAPPCAGAPRGTDRALWPTIVVLTGSFLRGVQSYLFAVVFLAGVPLASLHAYQRLAGRPLHTLKWICSGIALKAFLLRAPALPSYLELLPLSLTHRCFSSRYATPVCSVSGRKFHSKHQFSSVSSPVSHDPFLPMRPPWPKFDLQFEFQLTSAGIVD